MLGTSFDQLHRCDTSPLATGLGKNKLLQSNAVELPEPGTQRQAFGALCCSDPSSIRSGCSWTPSSRMGERWPKAPHTSRAALCQAMCFQQEGSCRVRSTSGEHELVLVRYQCGTSAYWCRVALGMGPHLFQLSLFPSFPLPAALGEE